MDRDKEYNQAFTAMARRHERIIFSACFFYASKELPFEDLRQEVLISLFKAYSHFRGQSSESTWVYKVAINTCLFSLRRLTPKFRTLSLEEIGAFGLQSDSTHEYREKLEWLHEMISGLNPMEKALILMWLDELTYDEIATNMGIPRNTVASRLHRIKEKLSSRKEV